MPSFGKRRNLALNPNSAIPRCAFQVCYLTLLDGLLTTGDHSVIYEMPIMMTLTQKTVMDIQQWDDACKVPNTNTECISLCYYF